MPGKLQIAVFWESLIFQARSGALSEIFFKQNNGDTKVIGERGGLVVNASDSGSRGRGYSGQTVLCP